MKVSNLPPLLPPLLPQTLNFYWSKTPSSLEKAKRMHIQPVTPQVCEVLETRIGSAVPRTELHKYSVRNEG